MTLLRLSPYDHAGLLCIPMMLYSAGGFSGRLASAKRISLDTGWRAVRFASLTSLLFALVCSAIAVLHITSLLDAPRIDSLLHFGIANLSFRFDIVESLMLLLVSFLGWVIVSYSHAYMAGDPRESSYLTHLMCTLASVSLLVVTNNLALFLAAWVLTSLSLHGLLTLYPNRQAAVISAHKKFLASRLGDITLLSAVVLLWLRTGSLQIDEITRQVSRPQPVFTLVHVAAVLLSISAIIKCAQLPLHGWLIQVMEAPTPVSALLHAGVVNLGGFMLIRLAPVIDTTPAAHALLVIFGCLTSTVASLVMTTRISIKVNLAWSTCAQMGFMLVECGLGLYNVAFLHLLAHSLYKAHAFLGSGSAVHQAKLKRRMPSSGIAGLPALAVSSISGLLLAALAAVLWGMHSFGSAVGLFCVPVVGMAIALILASVVSSRNLTSSILLSSAALGIGVAYFGFDRLFQELLPISRYGAVSQRPLLIFSVICFALLYSIHTLVRLRPVAALSSLLYRWLYAGLYLDELFTRATFRLWPAGRVSTDVPLRDATQPFYANGVKP